MKTAAGHVVRVRWVGGAWDKLDNAIAAAASAPPGPPGAQVLLPFAGGVAGPGLRAVCGGAEIVLTAWELTGDCEPRRVLLPLELQGHDGRGDCEDFGSKLVVDVARD